LAYPERMSAQTPSPQKLSNGQIALAIVSIVVFMIGLSFAFVPLYDLFCRMTGYAGTPRITAQESTGEVFDRTITVSFIATTDRTLPWQFKPEIRKMDVKVGQTAIVNFDVRNNTAKMTAGTALYNVSPDKIGKYFNKTQCFCFQEQVLNPGASAHFPVMFYIDPSIMTDRSVRDVTNITLSYTFYPAESDMLDKALEDFYASGGIPQ
jgi:cytochrome c oxidase assembly protein subunit 11